MKTTKDNEPNVLQEVHIRRIRPQEKAAWDRLIETEHYLGNACLVGEALRYVAEYKEQWVALIGWSAAAYHLKARDSWISWNEEQRRKRLGFVVANSRFLIRLDRSKVPNLATRVMKLCMDQLNQDWQQVHGHGVLLAETFVDPQTFLGTCYKAGNWTELGFTAGYRRKGRDYYEGHQHPKRLFVRELQRSARILLSAEQLPEPWAQWEQAIVPRCPFTVPEVGTLFDLFQNIFDPRRANGKRYSVGCILSIATCAILTGARDYQGIADFAARLSKPQMRRLRCWKNPVTREYKAPSRSCIWDVLNRLNPDEIDQRLGQWFAQLEPERLKALSIDGKTVRGAWMNSERQLHLFSAFSHQSSLVYQQCAVEEKSNEITAVEPLLNSIALDGVVVTADAMHAQRRAASHIVQQKGGDYLFTLKDNQPALRAKAQRLLPASFSPSGGKNGNSPWPCGNAQHNYPQRGT